MKEVYPGIFLIEEKGAYGAVKPPENVYILAGADGLIYDAGYGDKKTVRYLVGEIKKIEELYKSRNKEFKLTRVLPSHAHPDHISGANLLKKILGVRILLTKRMFETFKDKQSFLKFFEPNREEDLLSITNFRRRIKTSFQQHLWRFFYRRLYGLNYITEPDEIINENSEIIVNNEVWKIFHSPGHSPDHLSLYNEEKGVLFSGDNILRSITTWLGPPHCNIEDYVKSIEIIQKLPKLDLVLSAHGSPIENPRKRVNEILEHRKERLDQVIKIVKKSGAKGISPSEIVEALYPNEKKIMRGIARGWVCLTLKMLEQQNLAERKKTKKKILFFPLDKKI